MVMRNFDTEVYVARRGKAAAAVAPSEPSEFTIVVRFEGGLTDSQKNAFKSAADRWTRVIIGDLPAVVVRGETIDDLLIVASGVNIDGTSGILGQAGPTHLRPQNAGAAALLPARGIMEFDIADLARMEADGSLGDVITHEMGHVLGVGTIWEDKSLLRGAGTSTPTFIGQGAMQEYATLRGATDLIAVPVENSGGQGTRDSHWKDDVFGNELMTGFVRNAGNPLSQMTTASLQDLGYAVDLSATEPYNLPLPGALVALGATGVRELHGSGGAIRSTDPLTLSPESLVNR
jgi:Leishmanolysin